MTSVRIFDLITNTTKMIYDAATHGGGGFRDGGVQALDWSPDGTKIALSIYNGKTVVINPNNNLIIL